MPEPIQPDEVAPCPEAYCLALLAEEFGEALQWIGKAGRFGIDSPKNEGGSVSARTELPKELGDVQAAIDFTMAHGIVDADAVEEACFRKFDKLMDAAAKDNLGRPLAPQPAPRTMTDEVAPVDNAIAALRDMEKRNTELTEALERILSGDIPVEIGKHWRDDGKPSKHDECIHGRFQYEDCENCIDDFVRTTLTKQNDEQ